MITVDVEASIARAFDRDRMDSFWRPLHSAQSLTPELMAHKPDPLVVLEPRRKRIPDVFEGWTDMWFVRQPIRDAIEALEPSVHEFHEFRVVTEKKRTDLGVFHLLIIKQTIDCVVPEGTHYVGGDGRQGYDLEPVISPLGKVALNPDRLGPQHLWHNADRYKKLFFSDELYARLKKPKIVGWIFHKCRIGRPEDFHDETA